MSKFRIIECSPGLYAIQAKELYWWSWHKSEGGGIFTWDNPQEPERIVRGWIGGERPENFTLNRVIKEI